MASLGPTLLQILFIGLKLTGYVSWSWWAVMLPTIIAAILCLIFVLFWMLAVRK